jgi:hypothetical protein
MTAEARSGYHDDRVIALAFMTLDEDGARPVGTAPSLY